MTQIPASGLAATASVPPHAGPGPTAATSERTQLAQAATAFEAIFMRQLLGSMRHASLGEDIAGSDAVDQFRELADAKLADGLSAQGNLGVADMILQQLDRKP